MDDTPRPLPLESLHGEGGWVRRVARALAGGGAEADDIEQEAWLRALERRPRVLRSPRAWLGTVLRNAASDLRRATRRRRAREEAVAIPEAAASPPAEDLVARAESLRAVVDALLRLREPYRSTLLLRYQEGLSPSEIARRLDLPRETVRTRLRRGLEEMREDLGEGDGKERRAILLPLLGPLAIPAAALDAAGGETGAWAGGDRAAREAAAAFREAALMNVRILGAAGLSLAIVAGAVWWALGTAEPAATRGNPPVPPPTETTSADTVAASGGGEPQAPLTGLDRLKDQKWHDQSPPGRIQERTSPAAKEGAASEPDPMDMTREYLKLRKENEDLRKQLEESRATKSPTGSLASLVTDDLMTRLLAITRARITERKGTSDVEEGTRLVEELLSRALSSEQRGKTLVESAILHRMTSPPDHARAEAALREAAGIQGEDTSVGRETLFQLAWTRDARGDDREAADLFEKVAENPATEPGFRATNRWEAARRADRLGERDRALRLYEKFVAENESNEGPWFKDCVAKARKRIEELK